MKRFTLVAIALLVVAMGFAIGEKILTYKKSDKTPLKKQQITKTKLTREGTSPINVEGTLNMTVAAGETEVIDTLTITSETVTAVDIAIQGAGYLLAVYTPENEGGEGNNEGGEENNEGGEGAGEGGEGNSAGGEGAGEGGEENNEGGEENNEGGEDNNEGGEDNNEGGEENNEGGEGTEEGSGEGTEEGAKSGETSWVASLENVALPAKILVKYTVSAENTNTAATITITGTVEGQEEPVTATVACNTTISQEGNGEGENESCPSFVVDAEHPYNEPLTEGIPECWTVIDNNEDSVSWDYISANDFMAIYYGLPVGVNYWRGDTTADDYLVTQSLTLAENNYLVSFEYLGLGLPEKVVVVYGNAPEASALTNVLDTIELGRTEEVVNDIFHKELNITTEDEYYFGLHIISDTSGFIFYVADFNVMVNPTEIDADLNITQTEITTYVNRNVVIRGTLENNGAAINSYELVCKEGEEVLQTVTYSDLDMVIGMYHAFSFDPIQFETAGTHNLVVDVTKINGVDCNETPIAVTVIANEEPICNVEAVPYTENFNDGMPECWLTIDNNNDGYTWSSFTELLAAQNITVDASELIYEGADALTIWSFKPTNYNVATEEWNGQNTQLDDYVLTPEISIPSEGAVVTYYHMNLDGSTYPEKYSVYITTTTNVADFVLLEGNIVPPSGTQAAPYAEKTIAIPAEYNGQNVRIVFYNNTAAKFGMFIDNFAVTVPTAVEENIASAVSVYPNPANNVVTIANAEGQNVVVVNSLGQVVASVENATANHTIDLSNFANGTYFVKVGAEVVKLNIVK